MVAGDAGGGLEQAFLQGDQTVDGLLLGGAAGIALVVAVITASLERGAAAVVERIRGHYHVIGGGAEGLERHQVQLAGRLGHHEVHAVGQHLLHATRAQCRAVEGQLQQIERRDGGTEFGGRRCLDCDAGCRHGHDLDSLGRGPAIQGRECGDRVGEIGGLGGEFQGTVGGTGGQGAGTHRIGATQQVIEIARGIAFFIVAATTTAQQCTDDSCIN
ncbi:hypothetical protein D3C78_1352200 [compost metagenome]